MTAPFPPNEAERLEELHRYAVLDTSPEAAFDRITQLAARVFNVPIALISLVDEGRQWFKSCYGLDARETSRDLAFCAHALLNNEVLVVTDATQDSRFADNPSVIGAPDIRFYAGAPLVTPRGLKLGTLCVIDTRPRQFDATSRATLSDLAALVVDELELRLAYRQECLEIEERRRAEAALAASETHFRTLIENAHDIITILSTEGTIRYESPSLERVLGYRPAEITGRNAFDFVHPDDLPLVIERFKHVANSGAAGEPVEFRFLHKDGSWRWLEAVGSVQVENSDNENSDNNGNQNITGLVINSRDITSRKTGEEALRDSEARYAGIVETALDAIIIMNDRGQVIEWNPSAERIFGYKREQALSRDVSALIIPPHLRESHLSGLSKYLATGKGAILNHRIELPAVRADGQEITVELMVARLPLSGAPVFAGFVRDVTESKRAEERLRLLESVAVHANDAILITEAEPVVEPGPRILYANEAFTRETGYTLEDVVGKTPRILQGPETSRAMLDKIRAALLNWEPIVAEVLNYRKDGTPFWVELSIVPIADATGWYTHWVSIQRNITEKKKSAAALSAAKEEAEKANRAKSEFLSRMSHELRTPLNAILGFGQLLEMSDLSEEDEDSAQQITRAGQHLLGLINEVLDISRIETGNLSVSLEPVSLNEVVMETLGLVRTLAAKKEVILPGVSEAAMACEDIYVRADRQRLRQVLLNLLSNAIKYNRDQGSVSLVCELSDNNTVRLGVGDTGLGIAPEKLERLFTPFDRLGAEATNVEGTGIGLALSQRLMQLMGGAMGVDSRLGEGTTFWLDLARAENPALLEEISTTSDGTLPVVNTRWIVLYIEDNLPNLELLQRILARRPEIKLISAANGAQGLELARRHRPNLVLLDLHLPDMHGREVLQQLRAGESTRLLPVVILSADATPRQVERMKQAGAQAYLTKPFNIRELLRALDKHILTLELIDEAVPENQTS